MPTNLSLDKAMPSSACRRMKAICASVNFDRARLAFPQRPRRDFRLQRDGGLMRRGVRISMDGRPCSSSGRVLLAPIVKGRLAPPAAHFANRLDNAGVAHMLTAAATTATANGSLIESGGSERRKNPTNKAVPVVPLGSTSERNGQKFRLSQARNLQPTLSKALGPPGIGRR
jgi:hypothetical protein